MMMRSLDLFSGIGGFALGLERTGKFKTVAFCEPDPYCDKVLKQWWPHVPNFRQGIESLNALLRRASTSSRRASRARTYPLLAVPPDYPEAVRDSSGRYYEPFAWFDPATRSWRTWQRCLIEGWAPFSDTWPRSGMTRSGIAFRRQPLVPRTSATESGWLLPTPSATTYGTNQGGGMGRVGPIRPSLETMARRNLWPSPTATDGGSDLAKLGRSSTGISLKTAVRLWPTPTAGDAKSSGSRNTPSSQAHPGVSLTDAVRGDGGTGRKKYPSPPARDWRSGKGCQENGHTKQLPEVVGGQLNPTWTEWLMGFPLGWTALRRSATPSSRKSRSSSRKPSRVGAEVPP